MHLCSAVPAYAIHFGLLFSRFLFACRSSGVTSASVYYYYYYYYFFVDYSMYVIKICFVSYFLASQSYLDAKINNQ